MSTQHTPGPWRAIEHAVLCGDENDPLVVCRTDDEEDVCHVGNKPDGSEYEQCAANARLISAAPEMLEALKWAEPLIAVWFAEKPHCPDQSGLQLVRAAIAKATEQK